MSRIGASLSSFELALINRLNRANTEAALGSLRLATGSKINRPADDPSGFLYVSGLRAQLAQVTRSLSNVTAASAIVSQAQLNIDHIRTQLNTIRSKALEDQDQALSASARAANQAAIDSAIAEIDRLTTVDVGGKRLLDGSADFHYSGLNSTQVSDIEVIALGDSVAPTISGTVSSAAEQALLTYTGGTGQILANATFTLSGDRGSAVISVIAGELLTTAATRINQESHLTGVTASVSGDDLTLTSIAYGSDVGVAVQVTSGTFAVTGGNGDGTASGIDATATINGRVLTSEGNRFSLNENRFQFSIEFAAGFSGAFSTITVGGTGLRFTLSADPGRTSTLAVQGLQSQRLGGLSGRLDQLENGGSLAGLGTNAPLAVRVVDEALAKLTRIEGRIDGFANATIASADSLLSGLETELTDAIADSDGIVEAEEELLIAKNQQLADNAATGLAILALQRASIVELIRSIAGLD